MNEKIRQDLIDLSGVNDDQTILAENIVKENNGERLKELIAQFNLNLTKKDAIRVIKYNNLLDKVSDEILERIEKCPDEFTNEDLLKYLKTIHTTLDSTTRQMTGISDIPSITINQITIEQDKEEEKLDRESRRKIDAAVNAVLALLNKDNIELPEETIQEGFAEKIKENENETNNEIK